MTYYFAYSYLFYLENGNLVKLNINDGKKITFDVHGYITQIMITNFNEMYGKDKNE
jgi:hypothetical protein